MKRGQKVPDFRLQDETGEWVTRDDLRGGRVLLFVFQKAKSPGCEVTAAQYRDAVPVLRKHGVRVVGVSPDSWRRHGKFKTAARLPYTILADKDAALCQAFGIWKEKIFFGRKYMGPARSSFLIDAEGRLEEQWVDLHYAEQAGPVVEWVAQRGGKGRAAAAKPRAKRDGSR